MTPFKTVYDVASRADGLTNQLLLCTFRMTKL